MASAQRAQRAAEERAAALEQERDAARADGATASEERDRLKGRADRLWWCRGEIEDNDNQVASAASFRFPALNAH